MKSAIAFTVLNKLISFIILLTTVISILSSAL